MFKNRYRIIAISVIERILLFDLAGMTDFVTTIPQREEKHLFLRSIRKF